MRSFKTPNKLYYTLHVCVTDKFNKKLRIIKDFTNVVYFK